MQTPRTTLGAMLVLAVSCAVGSILVTAQVGAQGAASSGSSAIAECRGRALVGLPLGSGAGLGNLVNVVGVVNMGKTSCRLGGYPGLEATRYGHAYPFAGSDHGTYFGNLSPTVLAPRMAGALMLVTEDGCPAINQPNQAADRAVMAAHTYTGVVIELPQHDGSVVVNGVRFDTACGFSSSRLGWRSDLLGDDLVTSR
jgi:hypothetical protein